MSVSVIVMMMMMMMMMMVMMVMDVYLYVLTMFQTDCDVEWKFARTGLWMNYIDEGGTLPVPFNMIPTPKSCRYLWRWSRTLCRGYIGGEDNSDLVDSEACKKKTFIKVRRTSHDHRICIVLHCASLSCELGFVPAVGNGRFSFAVCIGEVNKQYCQRAVTLVHSESGGTLGSRYIYTGKSQLSQSIYEVNTIRCNMQTFIAHSKTDK